MSTHRGISPFMMSAHRGISPFHDVSPQRDIPLSWCQPTEGYPPFMMSAHRGISPFHVSAPARSKVHGRWPSWIHSFCAHLLHPSPFTPLYPLCVTWLDDKMRIGRNADDKMRIEKCGWEINCGWQNTDGPSSRRFESIYLGFLPKQVKEHRSCA